jgi:hypothetical protein
MIAASSAPAASCGLWASVPGAAAESTEVHAMAPAIGISNLSDNLSFCECSRT